MSVESLLAISQTATAPLATRPTYRIRARVVPPSMGSGRRAVWADLQGHSSEAGEGSRTPDLLFTRQVLYQLSYSGAGPAKASPARARLQRPARAWETAESVPEKAVTRVAPAVY
jgi:hypothetical protein